jgi:hypothetical protein
MAKVVSFTTGPSMPPQTKLPSLFSLFTIKCGESMGRT